MSRIAYVNGNYVPLREAGVHVEDRGYQFSDGVYEVCALRGGMMLDLDEHLERLDNSLAALRIDPPMSRAALKTVMRETVRRNHVGDGLVYLQITRGVAPRDHKFPAQARPALTITVRPVRLQDIEKIHTKGIKIITRKDERWARCDIKSVSLLANVMAKQAAQDVGAGETWLTDEAGMVREGASTTAWIVDAQGVLRTRPLGHDILGGITREILLKVISSQGVTFEERPFSVDEALQAREAFSSASTLTLYPVVEIDGHQIGDGKPGSLTMALLSGYKEISTKTS